jgi:hypothetical protein
MNYGLKPIIGTDGLYTLDTVIRKVEMGGGDKGPEHIANITIDAPPGYGNTLELRRDRLFDLITSMHGQNVVAWNELQGKNVRAYYTTLIGDTATTTLPVAPRLLGIQGLNK